MSGKTLETALSSSSEQRLRMKRIIELIWHKDDRSYTVSDDESGAIKKNVLQVDIM
jgi:hypothetical protein